jgi:hypothetical protein
MDVSFCGTVELGDSRGRKFKKFIDIELSISTEISNELRSWIKKFISTPEK